MLNFLKLFENVGQFDSVSTAGQLRLKPLTLIYAENGRGKTTLSAIFRSLATNDPNPINERRRLGSTGQPHVVIDCDGGPTPAIFRDGAWSRHLPNLAIFDDDFVDQNICSGLAIGPEHRQNLHELILGAQGVTLNQALQAHVETIEALTRSLRNLGNAIPETARFGIPVEEFCALPENPQVDEAIRNVERQLAALGNQAAIAATPPLDKFVLPDTDDTTLAELLAQGLEGIDETANAKVQRHCDAIGRGGESWVAEGVRRVEGGLDHPAGKPCPFCAQDLGGSSLVNHYRSYFATAYRDHKALIERAFEEFHRRFGSEAEMYYARELQVYQDRRAFWSRYIEFPGAAFDVDGIHTAWTTMRAAINRTLQAKANAPLDQIELDEEARQAIARYREKAAEVAQVSARWQEINGKIALVKERAATANAPALQADLARLHAIKSRHSAGIAPLCADFIAERDRKVAAEAARDAARVALDNYRTNIFPEYEAAINDCLGRFNAGFRLHRVASQNTRGGSSCTYNVLINNQSVAVSAANPAPGTPSFKSTLSAGDRNTLALAIFFAALEKDQNLAGKIVVIDDPVSSLDDHRSTTTVHEMAQLRDRVTQVIALSHSKPFLCALWQKIDDTLRAAIVVERAASGSEIRAWDINQDLITDHDRRHELLRNFVAGANVDKREVATELRPTLEAFLRVAFPKDYTPGLLLGQFKGICVQRVNQADQILDQADINELERVTTYANGFHHDSNAMGYRTQPINDAELLDFTKRTLAFAKR